MCKKGAKSANWLTDWLTDWLTLSLTHSLTHSSSLETVPHQYFVSFALCISFLFASILTVTTENGVKRATHVLFKGVFAHNALLILVNSCSIRCFCGGVLHLNKYSLFLNPELATATLPPPPRISQTVVLYQFSSDPWPIGSSGETIEQRSSFSLFGMSTLWCCPSSISSADHGIAHPSRCL